MKNIAITFFVILVLLSSMVKADEGMWLPMLIKKQIYHKMVEKGLKISAEDIYDVNKASLKDAVCGFADSGYPTGFWCTGEVISSQGLILTNHHCGYDAVQSHSSIENDYLTNGFWAKTKAEELPNANISVSFLVNMVDVTEKVLSYLNDTMTEIERNDKIHEISEVIEQEASENGKYTAVLNSFLYNNQFILLTYITYKDVRLVGAPPSSIGKFGGDTDNWMWPRHTGDFCLFRIYTAPDGSPAEYSKNNIPFKPKHHFPISLKGVNEGDFSMIMGFPGQTDRYMTSYGVDQTININNPAAIKIRTKKLNIYREYMEVDNKIRIQYSSKYASTSNYWKYFIGQNKGLNRLKVYDEKEKIEKDLITWIEADENRKNKYGNFIDIIEKAYSDENKLMIAEQYINEAVFQGPEIVMFPYKTFGLYEALLSVSEQKLINAETGLLKSEAQKFFKDFNVNVDKKVFTELFKIYKEDLNPMFHFSFFNKVDKKYKGSFEKYADKIYAKSIFTDSTRFNQFLANPSLKVLNNDPVMQITKSVLQKYFELGEVLEKTDMDKEQGMRLFLAAKMEKDKDVNFYPDANSTLRLTYGNVGAYKAMDAVNYKYFTTIKGIIEKEDSTNEDFVVAKKLKELYAKKDYGQYGENGDLKVCFITNNDITGGNSGSPAINGNGELIGTAFDGNWEAMSGDIKFENEIQKTIICDIRYVLFIIDKFAGATNIIDELTIVK